MNLVEMEVRLLYCALSAMELSMEDRKAGIEISLESVVEEIALDAARNLATMPVT